MPAKTDNSPHTGGADDRWRPRYSRVEDDSGSVAATPRPARAREESRQPAPSPRRSKAQDSFSRTRRVGGVVETCPKPTIKARWSKPCVTPSHNSQWPPAFPPYDYVPEWAKVQMLVETTDVPDGASAVINIHHCRTKALVKGGTLSDLVVSGNQVVDKGTGKPPQWVFEAEHLPWDPWNAPYFYFKAQVDYQGLKAETPSDYDKHEQETLRVEYLHAVVGDAEADATGLSTAEEAAEVGRKLAGRYHVVVERVFQQRDGAPAANASGAGQGAAAAGQMGFGFGSLAGQRAAPTVSHELRRRLWGSLVRNTYAFHQASHGEVNRLLLGDTEIGPEVVAGEATVPSVPRYLAYLDCCKAGQRNELALAFHTRGTEFVLGFQRNVGDGAARDMAEEFYEVWVDTHNCEPEKIVDAFLQSRNNARRYLPILRRRAGQPVTGLEVWRGHSRKAKHGSIPLTTQPAATP